MQNDFEQMEINNTISENPGSPPTKWGKKHFLKFGLIFLGILIIVAGGYFIWNGYLSPSAQYARQANANYQKYLDQQATYESAMKADTYGGKTPQETLGLFETALKSGDVDLASKYFVLDEDGTSDGKWLKNLNEMESSGKLADMINLLTKSTPAGSWMDGKFGFEIRNSEDKLLYDISMTLNKYSNVWKIENM
jgi:hypothetical protein